MRLHAGLPKMFWADSVNAAAYLINRGPSNPLGFRIPEEEWQGKEINLSHSKVFGCVSYVLVKDSDRDKLDQKQVSVSLLAMAQMISDTISGIGRVKKSPKAGMSPLISM